MLPCGPARGQPQRLFHVHLRRMCILLLLGGMLCKCVSLHIYRVHGFTKSWTHLSDWTELNNTHVDTYEHTNTGVIVLVPKFQPWSDDPNHFPTIVLNLGEDHSRPLSLHACDSVVEKHQQNYLKLNTVSGLNVFSGHPAVSLCLLELATWWDASTINPLAQRPLSISCRIQIRQLLSLLMGRLAILLLSGPDP